jgi:hypothetical protein
MLLVSTLPTSRLSFHFRADVLTSLSGPQVFLATDAPRYFTAFAVHMGCYVVLVLIIIFLRFYLRRQNTKRDRLQAELLAAGTTEAVDENLVHAFDDKTDRENINFRYVY